MIQIHKQTILFSISVLFLFSSCKKESTSEPQSSLNSSKGTITITARTSSLFKSLPPWPITVKLLRSNGATYDTVATAITDETGECSFTELPQGSYVGQGMADDHYPYLSTSNFVYLVSNVVNGTAMLYDPPRYHLAPDTIILYVDTTIVTDRTFSTFIMNDGAKDTLRCTFDTSQIPEWCDLTITTNIFRPLYSGTSDNNFSIATKAATFPRLLLPINITIPFSSQFENDTMHVRFVHQKMP